MFRHQRLFATAALAWALSLLLVAWVLGVWLNRSLGLAELMLTGLLLLLPVVFVVIDRLQRDRRKIDGMRDSALW